MNDARLARVVQMQKEIVAKSRAKKAAPSEAPRPEVPKPDPPRAEPVRTPVTAEPDAGPGQESDPRVSRELADAAVRREPEAGASSPELDRLLADAVAKGASDIHVHSGAPVRYRIHGRFEDQADCPLAPAAAEVMVLGMLTQEQRELFDARGEIDFSYSVECVGRFRTNVYRQLRGVDAVMRSIPARPPDARRAEPAPGAGALHQLPPRHGADHGPHRLRKVGDHGGSGRPGQRGARRAHPDH